VSTTYFCSAFERSRPEYFLSLNRATNGVCVSQKVLRDLAPFANVFLITAVRR
jgi:hypothetical protein